MIDLRNERPPMDNGKQGRKFCPALPPLVCTKTVNEGGEMVTKSEVIPIVCFGEDCAIFCQIHGMCMQKCEHLEMIHGIVSPDETDDMEDAIG